MYSGYNFNNKTNPFAANVNGPKNMSSTKTVLMNEHGNYVILSWNFVTTAALKEASLYIEYEKV